MRPGRDRRGLAVGTLALALALCCLILAAAYPRVHRALLDARLATVVSDVEAVVSAARRNVAEGRPWPAGHAPGEVPTEFRVFLPPDFSFTGNGYSLKWERWERVVQPVAIGAPDIPVAEPTGDVPPPAPPDSLAALQPTVAGLGAISLSSDDDRVLAALLDRFGASRSFIHDRSWILILPDSAGGD
jgi:hypothetical protein